VCREWCVLIALVVVLCPALDSVSQGAIPGLIGRWNLDEGDGTVAMDSSGQALDGTVNGGPTWMTGSPFDNSG